MSVTGQGKTIEEATLPEKKVLVLHSMKMKRPWNLMFNNEFASHLNKSKYAVYDVETENLDLLQTRDDEYKDILEKQLRFKYDSTDIDYIVLTLNGAAQFVFERNLFPEIPKVVVSPVIPGGKVFSDVIPVFMDIDFKSMLEHAFYLLPETKDVYIIGGSGNSERYYSTKVKQVTNGFEYATFHYLLDDDAETLLKKVESLPDNSFVFYLAYTMRPNGKAYMAQQFSYELAEHCNRPAFSYSDLLTENTGLLGGEVVSFKSLAYWSANTLDSLALGHSVTSLNPKQPTVLYNYEWGELQKWNIPIDKLPHNSIFYNRTYTFYELFKTEVILGTILIIVQMVFIFILVVNKRKRRKAEENLKMTQMHYTEFINWSTDAISYWKLTEGVSVELPVKNQVEKLRNAICVDANKSFWELHSNSNEESQLGNKYSDIIHRMQDNELLTLFVKNKYQIYEYNWSEELNEQQHLYTEETWFGIVENNQLVSFWMLSKDITSQKQIENSLKESEEKFRQLFNSLPVGAYRTSLDGRVVDANPAVATMLLYDSPEDLKKHVSNITDDVYTSPKDREETVEMLLKNGIVHSEKKLKRRDGSLFYGRLVISKTLNKNNEIEFAGTVEDITERTAIRKALQKSEEQLQHVFDSSPAIMMVVDENHSIIKINKQGRNFGKEYFETKVPVKFGGVLQCCFYSEEDGCLMQKECSCCRLYELIDKTITTGTPFTKQEITFTSHQYGVTQNHTFLVSTVRISNAPAVTVLVTIDDISLRKKTEEAFALSNQHYKELFQGSRDGIAMVHVDGGFWDVNQAFCDMIGYSLSELKELDHFLEITPKKWHEWEQREIIEKQLYVKGYSDVYEKEFIRKGGEIFPIEIQAFSNLDENNVPQYLFAIVRDITNRKKADKALKESEERLRLALIATNEGMWDWDIKKGEVLFSPTYYTMAGYEPYEFPQQFDEWEKRVHPNDKDAVISQINEYLASKVDGYRVEFRFRKKDNTYIWLRGKGMIVACDGEGEPERMVGTHIDIDKEVKALAEIKIHRENLQKLVAEQTKELVLKNDELNKNNDDLQRKNTLIYENNIELTKTLHSLKEAQERLVQAEKMASLGVLTAGVAHEINNPLNYIMGGYTGLKELFSTHKIEDDTAEFLFSGIKSGIDRVTNIVRGLNQFSRSNEANDEDCNIHAIIDNCLVMLYNQIKNRIVINKDYCEQEIKIIGNSGKLHQAFLNILTNAIQAIDNEGEIQVKTHSENKNVVVEIKDTGCGIEDSNISKVTDPFYTTKPPGEGTGLGLAITYRIFKEYNAQMIFQSKIGKGTVVKVVLPKN